MVERHSTSAPPRFAVDVVDGAQVRRYAREWEALSRCAVVPHVFYEPWALLPAVECLGQQDDLRFVLVFGPHLPGESPSLVGLFPLRIDARCLDRLPVRALAFWSHRYCFLSVPLVHVAHVRDVLSAFLAWFDVNPFGATVLDTNLVVGEGPFHSVWIDLIADRTSVVISEYPRAAIEPRGITAPEYISRVISNKHLHDYARQDRRLTEMGRIAYTCLSDPADVAKWTEDFLDLETRGWKGADGGAIASQADDAVYFREILRAGFAAGRAMLLSLTLDDKPIAMKCNLVSGDTAFTFKIAHDEKYAKFSPGVLLELENIRRLCAHPLIKRMDSCAMPRHPMKDRIWTERRIIRHSLISANARSTELLLAAVPLALWVKRQLKRRKSARSSRPV